MASPVLMMQVRFRSKLSFEGVMMIAEERAPELEALPGLVQKCYLEDAQTGEVGGCYLWESPEALADYRDSDLRASIGASYQAEGGPRVELSRIVRTLRP